MFYKLQGCAFGNIALPVNSSGSEQACLLLKSQAFSGRNEVVFGFHDYDSQAKGRRTESFSRVDCHGSNSSNNNTN